MRIQPRVRIALCTAFVCGLFLGGITAIIAMEMGHGWAFAYAVLMYTALSFEWVRERLTNGANDDAPPR